MLERKEPYAEKELLEVLTQTGELYRQLESVLKAAVRAVKNEDQTKAGIYIRKADSLLYSLGRFGAQEGQRTGRPRAAVRENGDQTLGQIRNSLRLNVPAGELAHGLGISESTFRRRMRKTEHLPDDVLFSTIP